MNRLTFRVIGFSGILMMLCLVFPPHVFAGVSLVQDFEEIFAVANAYFGYSVSGTGDLNGDGYDDVIVGAHYLNSSTGRAYVFYGGASMDNLADATLAGESAGNSFGISVAGAGDINTDGYNDVFVGAPGYNSNTGRAYIYYGGPTVNSLADLILTGESAGTYFGRFVSGAGDVNGDGYDDVIVGAYGYDSNTGRAYVFNGGSPMDAAADVTMTGEATDNLFGAPVSRAGDANGDGYGDVIVGAFSYNGLTGRAYVYFGGSSMDAAADVTMTGGATGDSFGRSASNAGDANGDGYDDVIVGAYGYGSYTGRAYVFYGGSSMNNTADVTMTGGTANDYFGRSVSGAGDLNGDGYDDVMSGAYGYGSGTGRAYVYSGGSSMNNAADVTMTGGTTGINFGFSVSGAGDVNGDGYADAMVGAYKYQSYSGRADIYFGGPAAMDNVTDVALLNETADDRYGQTVSGAGDVNADGYDDVIVGAYGHNFFTGLAYIYFGGPSTMDAAADVTLTGEMTYTHFSYSVSGAGDVNGDGYDDVIAGAYQVDTLTGRAYVYFGGSSMNNVADVTMTGEERYDGFGISVSRAGDVNHDGYGDVIVGAYGYSNNTGRAYVYFGGPAVNNVADVTMTGEGTQILFGTTVSAAGDVNGDGYDDVIAGATAYGSYTGRAYVYYGGSSMNNTADVTMTGEKTYDHFCFSASGAGDTNGDGYDDVIVGAFNHNSGIGCAYVYYGGSSMNNMADVTMTGEGSYNQFGYSVSDAGDMNTDGYDDVMVGAHYYNSGTGRAYVYFGGSPAMDNTADAIMTGEAASNYFGMDLAGAGDVNGDGMVDVIVGAYGYNANRGKVYIFSIFVEAKLKAWLQGPYQAGGSMTTALKTAGSVPLTSPYNDGRTAASIPSGVTDWVSLALRGAAPGPDICQRSFFLKSDGSLVDVDGTAADLKMPGMADGSYYLLVRHRNHLAAMSASAVSLGTASAALFDFSTGPGQVYGGDAMLLETGVYGLYSGDTDGTGTVDANDRSAAWNDRNKTGYETSDCNLSGTVDANDRSTAWNNRNRTTSVP